MKRKLALTAICIIFISLISSCANRKQCPAYGHVPTTVETPKA